MNNYKLIRELGRGSFGVTYLATRNDNNMEYALKVIDIQNAAAKNVSIADMRNEIESLKQLSLPSCNPFVLCYVDSFNDSFNGREVLVVVSDYVNGMTLLQLVENTKNTPLDVNYLWILMYQCVSGLHYIHSRGYAHRDIKLENIIIDNVSKNIKIIDFGVACTTSCTGTWGSLLYDPPEYFSEHYNGTLALAQKHDIWSLGVTFYVLANKLIPFSTASRKALINDIIHKSVSSNYTSSTNPKYMNMTINYIINSLFDRNPDTRPNINVLLSYIEDEERGCTLMVNNMPQTINRSMLIEYLKQKNISIVDLNAYLSALCQYVQNN